MRKLFVKRPAPYYIHAPDYRRSSSGIRVLHMLCDLLQRSGQEAYISAKVISPDLITPSLNIDIVKQHRSQGVEPIVVYPEITDGNPLGGKNVVRFILNQPGFVEGKGVFGKDDLLFSYTKALLQPGMDERDVLFFPVPDIRVFCPPSDPSKRVRGKVCYYQGRRGQAKIDPALLPTGAVEITSRWPDSWEGLADLFQQCEVFYCGEASALAGEAALCGCLGVVIPSEWAPQRIGSYEFKNYGVAWGTDPQEIERARHSIPLLRELVLEHQANFWNSLDRFIEVTQKAAVEREANTENNQIHNWLVSRILTKAQSELVENRLRAQSEPKLGLVVIQLDGDGERLERTFNSLQPSVAWHIHVLGVSPASLPAGGNIGFTLLDGELRVDVLNALMAEIDWDWVMLIEAGEELTFSGQLVSRLELLQNPDCRAISFDEIYRDDNALRAAFRPSMNLDYLLSFPAGMAHHWLFKREAVLEAGGFDSSYKITYEFDLLLRMINQGGLVGLGHISEPLVITDTPRLVNVEEERLAILRHLRVRGYPDAQVTASKPGRYRLEYKHVHKTSVSILITAGEELTKLQRCVDGLLGNTTYQGFEILLVESHPLDRAMHEWLVALAGLKESKLRIVHPECNNTVKMLNQAAAQAVGDYLLLLAPDTAVLRDDWLENLLNHAQRGEVGGVGGMLLTPDGKIAQAMQILGLQGPVGNPYVGANLDEPGYMQRLQVDQNVSALSPDCLMLNRELYIQLGGLDEEQISAPYSSTDLCLRIREAGRMLVWSPTVQLMLDRQKLVNVTPHQQDAIYAKWLPQLARDPYYNSNFSLAKEGGFKLADPQISWRPLNVFRPVPVILAHPADESGCGQYRVIQPFNAMRSAGLIDGALSRGLMHVTDLERYAPDVIVLQRQISSERLEAMRRMRAFSSAFKVYELDDYLPNLPLKSVHRSHMPKDIVKSLRRGLSYVDRFVVSTEAIAQAFADFHPDIQVRHNTLDPRFWGASLPESERRTAAKPRVGWAGGASHTGDLEMIEDVIKALAGEVEWVFFGMCPDRLRPYIHEYHPGVPIAQYPAALARLNLDLALAPVEQNLFNECKSNLRLLEYGACGYPVICSDIRCYSGDLPATRVKNRYRDWVDAIRMHLSDPDASEAMGNALRERVKGQWMLEGANLDSWREVWLPN